MEPHLVNRSWLEASALKALMEAFNQGGNETRIVGGAVRDALLGEEIEDIDCATTAVPEEIVSIAEAVGFKAIPTGIDHGTITVVVENVAFEVTTLRADIDTDGRHATVEFSKSFEEDAKRRDFTMNALSIDAGGEVHDPIGGYRDLVHREVKFIGDAETRCHEDYLRVLRFFRFFAWYGAGRPDRDGLRAVVRTKSGLSTLSVERVWAELKKTLSAPDPERAILWMRTTEVLSAVLPENWGLDQFHWMVNAERDQGWDADPMRRLQAMFQPVDGVASELSKRLKLSNEESARLKGFVSELPTAETCIDMSVVDFAKVLYRADRPGIIDALHHVFAKLLHRDENGRDRVIALIDFARDWERPLFPVKGADLKERGYREGRILGNALIDLEGKWVESGFHLSKDELLGML